MFLKDYRKLQNKEKMLKALVYILELLAIGLVLYLVIAPFWPVIKYQTSYNTSFTKEEAKSEEIIKNKIEEYSNAFPKSEYAISPNRLIITKIGVNAPIVESNNEQYGLSRGAWHLPESSTPDKGGNTVITGHRFKYLPPNNVTFYLFHKLEIGDMIGVIWHGQNYYYRIKEVKRVPRTEISILNQTSESILTLFTCDPIYSTEKRLVVISELIKNE